jgi:hypothetical protein
VTGILDACLLGTLLLASPAIEVLGVNVDPVRKGGVGLRGWEGMSTLDPGPWPVEYGLWEKTVRAFRDDQKTALCPEGFTLDIGALTGCNRPWGADHAPWVWGPQFRLSLLTFLAVEGSTAVNRSEFHDGTIEIVEYPIQGTGLRVTFPSWPLQLYALGGGARHRHPENQADFNSGRRPLGSDLVSS